MSGKSMSGPLLGAIIGFIGGVLLVALAEAPPGYVDALKVLAPWFALLAGWAMWLADQRKRHDALSHEVHRQCIEEYRNLTHDMAEVLVLVGTTRKDSDQFREKISCVYNSLQDSFTRQLLLVHEDVYPRIVDFINVGKNMFAARECISRDQLEEYETRLRCAYGECVMAMRGALRIPELHITGEWWLPWVQ